MQQKEQILESIFVIDSKRNDKVMKGACYVTCHIVDFENYRNHFSSNIRAYNTASLYCAICSDSL